MNRLLRRVIVTMVAAAMPFCICAAQPPTEPGAGLPGMGPRGPVGPEVPLPAAEEACFAKRVTVEGRTAPAVQAACDRAAKEGITGVFLPAGVYEFGATVRVPGGMALLGEGTKTVCRAKGRDVHLFRVEGDGVRFTRLKLHGADTSPSTDNDTYGITVSGRQNVRIDHCELQGFSYASNFCDEATAQVDHCLIHHNLRDGLGYGVAYGGGRLVVNEDEAARVRAIFDLYLEHQTLRLYVVSVSGTIKPSAQGRVSRSGPVPSAWTFPCSDAGDAPASWL